MADTVQELRTLLDGQPETPLRPRQIKDLQGNRHAQEAMLQAPDWQQANRGAATREIQRIDTMLAKYSPKPVEPARENLIARKLDEVLHTVLIPGMLPQEVMRRNPAGAVDTFQAQEGSAAWKRAALEWKRGKQVLGARTGEAQAPNFTNLERYRPALAGAQGMAATFMANAQIGGAFAMTPQAKANWPLGGPTVTTALDGAGYVSPEAPPPPHPNSSYDPAEDARARAAKAAGLETVPRQCELDGCENWFEASTTGPNPKRFCVPAHATKARGQTRTAKRKGSAQAPAQPTPEA